MNVTDHGWQAKDGKAIQNPGSRWFKTWVL
jgi:hypothetical protein